MYQLPSSALINQKVCARVDFNIPIDQQGNPRNFFKLDACIPTLQLLDSHAQAILLLTHLGSPKGVQEMLSTKHLLPALRQAGFECTFIADSRNIAAQLATSTQRWFLCENLRFWPQEKSGDTAFAQMLGAGTTMYIDDAFGTLHRTDCSITQLPQNYAANKRDIGPLVHTELTNLAPLKNNPARPFVGIMGGAKIATKMRYLLKFAAGITDTLLVCPPLSFSIMQAYGTPVGRSLAEPIDHETFTALRQYIAMHRIIMPVDYIVQQPHGSLNVRTAQEIRDDEFGIGIGPETQILFKRFIERAASLFFNGGMGFLDQAETLESTQILLSSLERSNAYRVIGGGDTVAMVQQLGYRTAANFLSTGGGSLLAYLAHEPLPGLDALSINY